MRCRRAFDADLTAVVRGDAADAAFAAHVASCPDCAAELRVWTELDAMLRAGAPPDADHPEPETLVAFVDAPATLAADARAAIERHLTACLVCADEVGGLRRFDPIRAAAASTPTDADSVEPAVARGGIARVLWHPAFAYALVAVLLVPLVRQQLANVPEASRIAAARREAEAPPAPVEPARDAAAARDGAAGSNPVPQAAPRPLPEVAPPPAPAPAFAERVQKNAARAPGAAPLADRVLDRKVEQRREEPEQALERAPATEAPAARAKRADEGASSLPGLVGRAGAGADVARGGAVEAQPAVAVVEIRSTETTVVPFAFGDRRVRLRVTPAPADLPSGPLDVRVRGDGGAREITTRVADRADAIVVEIPPGWLVPGDYVVTLVPVAAAPGSGTVNLPFRVAGPGGPR
jgi:hypothetical protein